MAYSYSICPKCREINKPCCDGPKIVTGSRWSAPRKTNDKAWAKIAAGNIWWDERRIQRPARAMRQSTNPVHYPYGVRIWHVVRDELGEHGYIGKKITNVGKKKSA